MRAPVRLRRGAWPPSLEGRLDRFVWDDPLVVLDPDATPEAFRTAMAAFTVGSTIKITGSNRHPHVDQLLLDHVDLAGATIVDIGASDGTTSVELVERLPTFGRFVIADLYITATAVEVGRRTVVLDHDREAVVVSGPRFVAWPALSHAVQMVYRRTLARAALGEGVKILLLGPQARALVASDPRVSWQRHDVFAPWPGPSPDVIKIANLLRPDLYFTQQRIVDAVRRVLADLRDGGHLLVVDNPRARVPATGTLYRRQGDRFVRVASVGPGAAIDTLVLDARIEPGRMR